MSVYRFVSATEPLESRRAVLIVNTKSRRGREWFQEAKELLTSMGIELEQAMSFRSVQELISEAKQAVERRVPLVIAGGGDGTFSAIAKLFVNSDSTLGVLPLGTGNAFARDLGIPADLKVACEIAARGRASQVDVGTVADDCFVNVATLGVTSLIARELTVEAKRALGRAVYLMAVIRALRNVRPFQVTLETENGTCSFETLQVVIGNGRYHAGPFPLSPEASITEGKLSLYAMLTTRKADFLKMALYLPTGRHVDLPEIHYEQTLGGRIESTPLMPLTVDGEVCARTPAQFGVKPRSLRVMTPVDADL